MLDANGNMIPDQEIEWFNTGWLWFWLFVFWPVFVWGLFLKLDEDRRVDWGKKAAIIFVGFLVISFALDNVGPEKTKSSQSGYNDEYLSAGTSVNLSKADLAWHAQNTYGWDCSQVVTKGDMLSGGYFYIHCPSGKKLRVYPRSGQHPKITNSRGGYN